MLVEGREKNEYGHHLLDLSLRSVRARAWHSRRHTRTQCAVGEGIWKYGMEEREREEGRKRGSQQLTWNRGMET